jgi:hypothetical protein
MKKPGYKMMAQLMRGLEAGREKNKKISTFSLTSPRMYPILPLSAMLRNGSASHPQPQPTETD